MLLSEIKSLFISSISICKLPLGGKGFLQGVTVFHGDAFTFSYYTFFLGEK